MNTISDHIIHKWNNIDKTFKSAFFIAIAAGFLVHISSITGMPLNWDSMGTIKENYDFLVSQGKWLTPLFTWLRDTTEIGSLQNPIAIFWMALAAGIIVRVLNIRSTILAGIAGACIVMMPSILCLFVYPAEDTFTCAAFLAVLSVYIVSHCKNGYIFGCLILVLALGIYPPYIGFASGLFVILCFLDSLNNKKKAKDILLQAFKYFAFLCISIGIYYIIAQIVWKISGIAPSAYFGINEMANIDIQNLPHILYMTYKSVLDFMLWDASGLGTARYYWAYRFILLIFLVTTVYILRNRSKKGKRYNCALALLFILLLPWAVHAVGILSQSTLTHWIMKYPFVLLFIVPIKLTDMVEEIVENNVFTMQKDAPRKWTNVAPFAIVLLSFAAYFYLTLDWYVVTNQGYTATRLSYSGAYNCCVQIADDVMEIDSYKKDDPVCVIGGPSVDSYYNLFPEFGGHYTGITDQAFIFAGTYSVQSMLNIHLGTRFSYADAELENIRMTEEFKEMPSCPDDGYVKRINGIIVAKIGD